jgi:hypothetical protein
MTEERDPKVSKRYRGLGREEPPRELDERILAASRRAGRADRYRWAAPLATAAILVLAIGVALNVERRQPELDVQGAQKTQQAKEPQVPAQAPAFTPDPKLPEPSREMRARPQARSAPAPEPQVAPQQKIEDARQPAPAAASPPASADNASMAAEVAARRDAQAGARSESAQRAKALAKVQEPPEVWLERIADLRREGKQEEADRQLAEFKRGYPDYRYSDEMKAKVERPAGSLPAR